MRYIGILRAEHQSMTTLSLDDLIGHISSVKILSRGLVYLLECAEEHIEQARKIAYPYYLIIEDFDEAKRAMAN